MNKQKTETSLGNPGSVPRENCSFQTPCFVVLTIETFKRSVLYAPRILIPEQPQASTSSSVGSWLFTLQKYGLKKKLEVEMGEMLSC